MGPESPTSPGSLADPAPGWRIDPIRYAVQAVLVLYLLPVIALVAAIGLVSIVVGRSARLIARAFALIAGLAGPTVEPGRRVIGLKPILVRNPTGRSRIIR